MTKSCTRATRERLVPPFIDFSPDLSDQDILHLTAGFRREHPNSPRVINVSQREYLAAADPFGLNRFRDEPHTMVLYGCGNIYDRLMKTGFQVLLDRHTWLRQKLHVVLVDPCPEEQISSKASFLTEQCRIETVSYMTPEVFSSALREGRVSPDAVYQSLPHTLHLAETERLLEETAPYNSVVYIEKPIVIPDHVGSFRTLLSRYPGRVADTDHFSTDLLFWLTQDVVGQDLIARVGPIHTLTFHCVETIPEWRPWMHIREHSGGGTLLDCTPHSFHQASVFLAAAERIHARRYLPLTAETLTHAAFSSYFTGEEFNAKTETAGVVRLHTRDSGSSLTVLGQAGKATCNDFYGFEVYGTSGNYLAVALGTDSNPRPHIRFSSPQGDDVMHVLFDTPSGAGAEYGMLFQRALAYAKDRSAPIFPTHTVGLEAATSAVEILGKAEQSAGAMEKYSPGEAPRVWIPVGNTLLPEAALAV